MDLVGTLPLSSVNTGLAVSVGGLNAEVAKFQADVTDLSPAIEAQIEVASHFPPNAPSFAAVLAAGLSTPELAALLTPGNVTFAASEANVALAAKLGFIEGQISAVGAIRGSLSGGLAAGSITGWSYGGRCNGFGPMLEPQTALGFSEIGPADDVSGILIVTQSLTSWQQFAKSVSADPATTPTTANDTRLTAHGKRSGAGWNSGLADIVAELDAFQADMEGMKANIEASIRFSVGGNLPDPGVIADAGVQVLGAIGIDGLVSDFVNVRADVGAAIGAVQGDVDATLSLVGELSGQLSAGGFSVWSYTGRADGFGKAVTSALRSGLPGGAGPNAVVYGLALAGTGPSMGAFSGIFRTA